MILLSMLPNMRSSMTGSCRDCQDQEDRRNLHATIVGSRRKPSIIRPVDTCGDSVPPG